MSLPGIAMEFTMRHLLAGRRSPLQSRGVLRHGRTQDTAVRARVVHADDGVELYVEVRDAPDPPVTVVFCHGCLLDSTSWHAQRATLAGRLRVVCWDLRGHGRSGWGHPSNATIDQLGHDLFAVLEATAPRGPVVLAGHSMGGMAILGLAESHPELFGGRVIGVLLASTSAGDLSTVTVGLPARMAQLLHRVVPVTLSTLRHQARLIDAARRPLGGMSFLLTWPYLFGDRVPRPVARLTTELMASIPIEVIADFYEELITYDKRAALPVLGRVPVHVIVGAKDMITPATHSEALASAIRGADLTVVPDAGHLLILERPVDVGRQLWTLLGRAGVSVPAVAPALSAVATAPSNGHPARSAGRHREVTLRRLSGAATGKPKTAKI